MGNKSTSPPGDPETEMTKGHANNKDTASGNGPRGPPGPSPDLLASLQSLGEHSDHTLLPQSLHQIAEAYSLDEDYQWAVQFLQLERLYHERLLSNLAALQEDWERKWREHNRTAETNTVGQEHIEVLSKICRTHKRPMVSDEKSMADTVLKDSQDTRGQCEGSEKETSPSSHVKDRNKGPDGEVTSTEADPALAEGDRDEDERGGEEGVDEVEEVEEEGQEVDEVFEESPEDEVQVVEWPAGVPQASAKDLVKLSHVEESSSPDGLVSILKRRRASLDGLPPEGPETIRQNCKRKVRFSEPEDGMEPDEMGKDSCLILLLLCLVTVVISLGGTALYCALVDTYSSICTDFSHNVDIYVVYIQRFLDGLKPWLPLHS
ncbi:hypothetical protein UPYG_G00255150 [Umbra pygmaea]|uniref:Consortin n=1 Tax=Umbra pygmaea TaxID=75934 RepID=A0ABD0WQ43_UMBPY